MDGKAIPVIKATGLPGAVVVLVATFTALRKAIPVFVMMQIALLGQIRAVVQELVMGLRLQCIKPEPATKTHAQLILLSDVWLMLLLVLATLIHVTGMMVV